MKRKEDAPEVRADSDSELHRNLWKTLVLLAIDGPKRPVYFVVEGLGIHDNDPNATDLQEQRRYFYEEHTCPTNFVGGEVVALYEDGDRDPHGVFRFVRAVWMPKRYLDAKAEEDERRTNMGWGPEDVLEELFPELIEGRPRRCIHQGKTEPINGASFSASLNGDSTMISGGEYTSIHHVPVGEVCEHPDRIVR